MNKITYLFGAGASRHALPIVSEMPDRIKALIELLEGENLKLDDKFTYTDLNLRNPKTNREFQLEMIASLKWIMEASQNHASVDTFAKKLFIKRKYEDLKRLKIVMSVFFIFEQALNKADFRYDAFFASLLNSLSNFPDNVRILSWNYDYQFELAFTEYSDQQEISANQSWLKINSKYGDNDRYSGFGIYKLNGTTGLYSDGGWRQYMYVPNLKVPVDKTFVNQVTRNFVAATYLSNIYSSLSFAWEPEQPDKSIVTKSIENTKDTVSLVIIGYSFPFFNREIDRKIIGSMTNLKKVYLQAPDAEIIKERFQAIKDDLTGIELITKFDVGQFLLPNEL